MVVVLRNPEHLALSDHLRCFDTFDYVACGCQRARSLHGSPPPLHMAMVGFNAIVSIARPPVAMFYGKLAIAAQFADRRSITSVSVHREHPRWPVVRIGQRNLQEPFRRI